MGKLYKDGNTLVNKKAMIIYTSGAPRMMLGAH